MHAIITLFIVLFVVLVIALLLDCPAETFRSDDDIEQDRRELEEMQDEVER
jgi:hypothetical protein